MCQVQWTQHDFSIDPAAAASCWLGQ